MHPFYYKNYKKVLNCTFLLAKILCIIKYSKEGFIMFVITWIIGLVMFVECLFRPHPKYFLASAGGLMMVLSSFGLALGIE